MQTLISPLTSARAPQIEKENKRPNVAFARGMAEFVESQASEKKSKKRGRAPPGGFSPQKTTQPWKPKKITHAVPTVLVLHQDNEELTGCVSVHFAKEAADLRELLKANVRYEGIACFRFHWGAMCFTNIDPNGNSTPLNPVLLSPAVHFIREVTEVLFAPIRRSA